MTNIPKVVRLLILGLTMTCFATVMGVQIREVHQFVFLLGIITIFSLVLDNIWLTAFLLWTVFLYILFKWQTGYIYLINVFLGSILYFLTKKCFRKEHITFFLNAILWVIALNLIYMIVQRLGFEFVFSNKEGMFIERPIGFMGNSSYTGILITLAIPIFLTRPYKRWICISLASLMLIPLVVLQSSLVAVVGIVGALFVLFFKINRKVWVGIVVLLTLLGSCYLHFVDKPGVERLQMWRLVLKDCAYHPITGWGLDSFRNMTKDKQRLYLLDKGKTTVYTPENPGCDLGAAGLWDNPHNLYLSIFYEWGIIGILLLIGYARQLCLQFKNAIKSPNMLALAAICLMVFVDSFGHFPMFLARLTVILIPIFALFSVEAK